MFFIKIKIKGYLKNLTKNTQELIDTTGINYENKITYIIDNVKYNLEPSPEKIILTRENNEYRHIMIFELNKETETKYYVKELNSSIFLKIKTNKLEITKRKIKIKYNVFDTNDEYIYSIEMSDK